MSAFTLDTSDPHQFDPHQFDPHQRVHTRQKDNPHQIDPHQLKSGYILTLLISFLK